MRDTAESEVHAPLTWDDMWKLVGVGCMQGIEIGCFNKALEFLTVSKRTMILSMNQIFVLIISACWGLERIGLCKVFAAVLLTTGASFQGLSSWSHRLDDGLEGSNGFIMGNALAFGSMLVACFRWAIMQHLTQRGSSRLVHMSKLQIVWRVSPWIALVCFLLSLVFERPGLDACHPAQIADVLIISLGIMLLMSAEILLVQLTSAVAFNVAAALHNIPVVLSGVFLFHDVIPPQALIGFGFCLMGALMYVFARYFSDARNPEQVGSKAVKTAPEDAKTAVSPMKGTEDHIQLDLDCVPEFQTFCTSAAVDERERLQPLPTSFGARVSAEKT